MLVLYEVSSLLELLLPCLLVTLEYVPGEISDLEKEGWSYRVGFRLVVKFTSYELSVMWHSLASRLTCLLCFKPLFPDSLSRVVTVRWPPLNLTLSAFLLYGFLG